MASEQFVLFGRAVHFLVWTLSALKKREKVEETFFFG